VQSLHEQEGVEACSLEDTTLLVYGQSIVDVVPIVEQMQDMLTQRPESLHHVETSLVWTDLPMCGADRHTDRVPVGQLLAYAAELAAVLSVFQDGYSGCDSWLRRFEEYNSPLVAFLNLHNMVTVDKALKLYCETLRHCLQTLLGPLSIDEAANQLSHYAIERFGHPQVHKNKEEVLMTMMELAHRLKLDTVEIIDMATLQRNCAAPDAQRAYVQKVVSEAQECPGGAMLVLDLDSIACVTKEYQSLSEDTAREVLSLTRRDLTFRLDDGPGHNMQTYVDATFTYKVHDQAGLLAYLLQIIREGGSYLPTLQPVWICILASEPYLVSCIKQQFTCDQWPLSPGERDELTHRQQENMQRVCATCGKRYTDRDNEAGECRGAHHGRIVWRPGNLDPACAETFGDIAELLAFLRLPANENIDWSKWVWRCCGAPGLSENHGCNGHAAHLPA